MYLTWCRDRADIKLEVHKIQYKSVEKDLIKFRATISHRRYNADFQSKNFKMSFTRFKQLERVDD